MKITGIKEIKGYHPIFDEKKIGEAITIDLIRDPMDGSVEKATVDLFRLSDRKEEGMESRVVQVSLCIWFLALVVCAGLVLVSCSSGGGREEIRPYDDTNTEGDDEAEDDDAAADGDDDGGEPSVGTDVGDRVPDFSYSNQNGSSTTLYDSEGKVILLCCAATW